jgi:YD repeat-containing protein
MLNFRKAARMEWLAATALAAVLTTQASANETTTYTYDALGRLTNSATTGTVNSGMNVSTVFDAAGNRTNYTVTGSTNTPPSSGSGGVIVLPLNGYTIIPLQGAGGYGL